MDTAVTASLMITYAVVQTGVFLLLARFVDLYEREPLSVVAVMALWGAIGATTLSALGNVAVSNVLPPRIEAVFGQAIYAPMVEEVAKGIALIVFVGVSLLAQGRYGIPYFEGVTDGIVYGAAIGLGFAFTEDVLFLLIGASHGGLEQGLLTYLSRRDFFGLSMFHHAIYTSAFGVGLGLATWSRRRVHRLLFPVGGLLIAMVLHAVNNGLVQFTLTLRYGFEATLAYLEGRVPPSLAVQMDATASSAVGAVRTLDVVLILAFVGAVYLWLRYQRRLIVEELSEEAESGLISRTELDLMPAYWRRTRWYWQLVKSGQWERWRLLKRMHNELVDLAFLKRRVRRSGDASAEVEARRRLIAKLKAQKAVFL